MKEEGKAQRILAVQRSKSGENPEPICTSLNKSKAWLYKWNKRYTNNDEFWSESRSRRPISVAKIRQDTIRAGRCKSDVCEVNKATDIRNR